MKKFPIIYFLLIAAVSFSSCKKFLDLPPRNQRAVESLDDVKSVLAGYLDGVGTKNIRPIVGAFPLFTSTQIMMFESYSDNIDFKTGLPIFVHRMNNTNKEIFYANNLLWNEYDAPKAIWTKYYETIGFLNALIETTEKLNPVDLAEKDRVIGEMLVHRAFYFFKLNQYFAPYKEADMGIPVYLLTGDQVVGIKMSRKKQSDVYKVITDDLSKALAMAGKSTPRKGFNIFYNERYIQNLMAQVYWFKAESGAKEASDYEEAQKYSLAAVSGVEAYMPKTVADLNAKAQGLLLNYPAFFQSGNSQGEVSGMYGSTWDYLGYYPQKVPLADDFFQLFSDNDIRKATYFIGNTINSTWPDGKANGSKNAHYTLFQPEVAYLILAESYYRLNKTADAVTTLNTFKSYRNAGTATGLSGDQLLQEIINERRKEFFTDTDKRWLDLKRYGTKTISRSLRFFDKDYTIEVKPNAYQYALPIPITELQQNPDLIQNAGWVPMVFN
ncbi:MAG: RagB/SusD family nutrient uptake outer membrane protein [Ginsengibacter sp.]